MAGGLRPLRTDGGRRRPGGPFLGFFSAGAGHVEAFFRPGGPLLGFFSAGAGRPPPPKVVFTDDFGGRTHGGGERRTTGFLRV